MTLNITALTPWGIWQCSDFRLTYLSPHAGFADISVKHLMLQCPDGKALIIYTGLGRFRDPSRRPSFVGGHANFTEIDIAEWLADRLAGETRTLRETAEHVASEGTKLLADLRYRGELTFSMASFSSRGPGLRVISNLSQAGQGFLMTPSRQVRVIEYAIAGPLIVYAGEMRAVSSRDRALLLDAFRHRPRHWQEFSTLLGDVNERASKARTFGKVISPSSYVSYLPPEGHPVSARVFDRDNSKTFRFAQHIDLGINVLPMMKQAHASLLQVLDDAKANKESIIEPGRLTILDNALHEQAAKYSELEERIAMFNGQASDGMIRELRIQLKKVSKEHRELMFERHQARREMARRKSL